MRYQTKSISALMRLASFVFVGLLIPFVAAWAQQPDNRRPDELKSVIDKVFPIADAQAAHAYVRENRNIGKVVLEVKG